MIKVIFFDFDGVLTTDSSGAFTTCTNIQRYLPDVPFDRVLQCYRVNHPKMLIGQTTHVKIWKEFCKCVGKDIDIKILDDVFRNTPMNTKMLELARMLKNHYRLGIITDNSKERLDTLKEAKDLPALFEMIVVSGEMGVRKDSEEIFFRALEMAQCKPEECVFIDNSEDNLIAARKFGLHTIFHDHKKNDVGFLSEQLVSLGVITN